MHFLTRTKLVWLILLVSVKGFGQSGPGGVGNSTTNKLWLRADAVTGVADGGAITTWDDESGNNHDAVQNTAANKPIWDQSNSNFNNKSTVHFDGINDNMDLTSLTNAASNYSIWFVYKTTSTAIQFLYEAQTGTLRIPHEGGGTNKAYHDGTGRGTEITGTGVKMVHWDLNSSGAGIYENGTQTQSGLTYVQRALGGNRKLGSNDTGGNRF
ncbi:MAG TPA: hypothetical protein VNJ07_15000, partial [Chitinophagales bacterium]|nr:hypothetical protein [Chitinophagales bacterium]